MTKLSRRELARLAAGMTAARAVRLEAQAPAPSTYIGPLTGVEKGLEDRRFDPVAYTLDLYAAAPRRLRFQARTRSEAEEWQKALRSKLTELVGGFPAERQPLRPITLETRTFPGYTREKIVFDSRPGVSVLAYLLLPEKAQTAGARHDLHARPRPRRGRHRRHRRPGRRPDRQGRLSARLRHPGGRSRHGGRGDRADGLRLPSRPHQRASGPVAQSVRSGGGRRRCWSVRR